MDNSVTRARLQEKFGVNENLIIYNHEKLVNDTEKVMKAFSTNLKIDYTKSLCEPTIGNLPWGGNSHYGKSKGINKDVITNYKRVLNENEINFILKQTKNLRDKILNRDESFLDLTNISEDCFNDYFYQKIF